MELYPGYKVKGYTIEAKIADGTFGRVFKVKNSDN